MAVTPKIGGCAQVLMGNLEESEIVTDNEIILGLAAIIVLGIGAQWIGKRTGVPSLLLLLPAGLLAGDVTGLVQPEEMFGDLLFPLVSLLLSLLLFQSGLGLRSAELPREARRPVLRLLTIGLAVTFAGATGAVMLALDVPTLMAALTGAILVVSGPTVVGPLLDAVRPSHAPAAVLRWEGTTLDPIGATLAVVVLNLTLASDRGGIHPVLQMLSRLGVGVAVGMVAAGLLVFVMWRFLLTDSMEPSVALLFAAGAFAVAEVTLSEAGLFATVTMGLAAANQRLVPTARIRGFGDTLEVIIIGTLFIVLGALVELGELREYAVGIAAIVAILVVVIRPITAAVALMGSSLSVRERAFIGSMDPRGIVAAATAAQFSVLLAAAEFDADFLLPVVFGVILGTGLIYGILAKPVAKLLGVARPESRGVGLLGDDPWLIAFGSCLAEAGVSTLLVTTEASAQRKASEQGHPDLTVVSARDGDARVTEVMERSDIRSMIISIPQDMVTTLITREVIDHLGRRNVMHMPVNRPMPAATWLPERWSAEPFGGRLSRLELETRFDQGQLIKVLAPDQVDEAVLLAGVGPEGRVTFRPDDHHPESAFIGMVGTAVLKPAVTGRS